MFPEHTISKSSKKLYKLNELATGSFVALGQNIDLARLRLPMYFLLEAPTKWLPPEPIVLRWSGWLERRRSTSAGRSRRAIISACFMGRQTLEEYWPRIVR